MDKRFGFIHEKLDIKILILYILNRISEPVTLDELAGIALCDGGISYFDFAECVAELVATEHICADGDSYIITEKGKKNGNITENSLPYSVRVKAGKNASSENKRLRRKSMLSTSRTIRRGGGYTVSMSLSDGISEILSIDMFAANEEQATALEKGFNEKAEQIFNTLLAKLLE